MEDGRKEEGGGGEWILALSAQLASVSRATRYEVVVVSTSRQSGHTSGTCDALEHRHSLQSRHNPRSGYTNHAAALLQPMKFLSRFSLPLGAPWCYLMFLEPQRRDESTDITSSGTQPPPRLGVAISAGVEE